MTRILTTSIRIPMFPSSWANKLYHNMIQKAPTLLLLNRCHVTWRFASAAFCCHSSPRRTSWLASVSWRNSQKKLWVHGLWRSLLYPIPSMQMVYFLTFTTTSTIHVGKYYSPYMDGMGMISTGSNKTLNLLVLFPNFPLPGIKPTPQPTPQTFPTCF